MTAVLPNAYMAPPTPRPLVGTLLDAATITEGVGWMDTEALGLSYNCLATNNWATWPCPQNLMAAPVQTASSTSTTGGTLAAGTYRIRITATNTRGETTQSNEITQVTTGATSRVIANWNNMAAETGYKVYISNTNGAAGTERLIATVGPDVLTYNWTGTPAYSATNAAPPTTNTAVIDVAKSFVSPAYQDGFKFAVYAGMGCESIGFDMEDATQQAERVFRAKESNAVEQAFMAQRFIASAGNWAAPTDLTPAAGAVKPAVGLAILEGHAAQTYAGAPTIHAPRTVGALLWFATPLAERGGVYYSPQGSKVASGGGYQVANQSPAGVAAPAGELWMYATGEVTVARGEVFSEMQLNRDNNEVGVLVERAYIASVDCYAAAVRVKVDA